MILLKSAVFGLLLLIASCVLLFWAEGRAVKTARALEEGASVVIPAVADRIDPAHEGRLVHVSGNVAPQDVPRDQRLGIAAEGAVRLDRNVEMYQWKEISREVERTASDGSTTKTTVYDYEAVWSARPLDSSRFKMASAPKNPPMPISGEDFRIIEARLGAFSLTGSDVAGLGTVSAVPLSDQAIAGVAQALGKGGAVWLAGDRFIVGADPEKPVIGDLRISYDRSDLATASVVAAQKGDRLVPYVASNGREVFLIQSGAASADAMFKDAAASNAMLTWMIRAGGLFLMFVSFAMIFAPLTGTLGRLPVIGGLISGGVSLVAMVMTLALGALVIAAGWIFYRPLLAIVIAVIGIGLAMVLGVWGRKKPAAAQPAR